MAKKERFRPVYTPAGWLDNRWDMAGVVGTWKPDSGSYVWPFRRGADYWSVLERVDAWPSHVATRTYEKITTSDTQKGFKDCDQLVLSGHTGFPDSQPSVRTIDWWVPDTDSESRTWGTRAFGRDRIKAAGLWDFARTQIGYRAPFLAYDSDWSDESARRELLQSLHSKIAPLSSQTIEQYCARAVREMAPAIQEKLSLLVSLSELGDLKSLVTAPINLLRRAKAALKRPTATTLKDLIRATAEGHLTYVFGAKPLTSDIVGVFDTAWNVKHELDRLFNGVGERQVRHWSPPKSEYPISIVETAPFREQYFDMNWSARYNGGNKVDRRFVVTIRYTYTLVDVSGKPITREDATPLGVLDSLGVNLNPAILWDKVPFSFVLDWFLSVDDWLDSFKRRNINPVVTILDACWSEKLEYYEERRDTLITYANDWSESSGPYTVREARKGTFKCKTYTRRVFVPRSAWLHGEELRPSLPSLGQWMIGGSLVMANSRRS